MQVLWGQVNAETCILLLFWEFLFDVLIAPNLPASRTQVRVGRYRQRARQSLVKTCQRPKTGMMTCY